MPIDSKTVPSSVATGVSYVRSICERFHEGREKKMDRCTAVDGCGSPIVRGYLSRVCGPFGTSPKLLRLRGAREERH